MSRRVVAYIVLLLGYLLYCYNFVVPDYVRPYLIERAGFTIRQTAIVGSAGNIGITIGAIGWAAFIARTGRRRASFAISAAIGLMALVQAVSNAFPAWVIGRALLTAALGGYYVVATSLVVALFPVEVRGKLVALNSAMYPTANILVGVLGGLLGDAHWHVLLWIGALPLPLALVLFAVVPADSSYQAYDMVEEDAAAGSWREMLTARLRWLTIGCVLLSGIDFNAYQLFFSFVTFYVHQARGMSAQGMGAIVALISSGQLVGSFAWAIISDRFGRRLPLIGYLIAAAAIAVFLRPGLALSALSMAGFAFGFGLACTTAWGAWFAEIFPIHLRPHGAALFHAGHMLALGSPLFAAFAMGRFGLVAAMSLASAVYIVGAMLWFMLPETLGHAARNAIHAPAVDLKQ